MNIINKSIFFSFFLLLQVSFGKDIVLLGFNSQGVPKIEKSFDRLLREKLAITPGVQIKDYIQSQRYRQQINFNDYPVISKEQIESIAKYMQDTTYFVWGVIKKFKLYPNRRYFFQARIKGELTILLNVYSLSERKLAYAGNIMQIEYLPKGLVFLMPVSKSINISVLEQTELLEKLENSQVTKICQIISAVMHSEIAKTGENIDAANKNAKAINDVLTTPSIEAALVKKDATLISNKDSNKVVTNDTSVVKIDTTENKQQKTIQVK